MGLIPCAPGIGVLRLWGVDLEQPEASLSLSCPHPRPIWSARLRAALILFGLLLFSASLALAEPLHVSVPLDPALPQAQARQQALDRAMAEAVHQDSLRILPAPLAQARSEALRRFLEPKARELVLSYQEAVAKAQPQAEGASAVPQPGAAPAALEYALEVNRPALRTLLQRLGLLSGGARAYSLRLGPGVSEPQLKALEELNLLMGLERVSAAGQAALDITLEKLPQGYYKAVLRQQPGQQQPGQQSGQQSGQQAPAALAADGGDLPAVWQNIFAMLFTGREFRPGGAARPLEITGWRGVDGVLDLDRLLASWDDCVQEPRLSSVSLSGGRISARWTARVTAAARLSARLAETLPERGLELTRPEGQAGGAAKP